MKLNCYICGDKLKNGSTAMLEISPKSIVYGCCEKCYAIEIKKIEEIYKHQIQKKCDKCGVKLTPKNYSTIGITIKDVITGCCNKCYASMIDETVNKNKSKYKIEKRCDECGIKLTAATCRIIDISTKGIMYCCCNKCHAKIIKEAIRKRDARKKK